MSKFDQFRKDGGFEYNDCYYDSPQDLLQTGMLDFCACGCPEENLKYVLGGLKLIAEKAPDNPSEWGAWYYTHTASEALHFGNQEATWFFKYWCDKEGYTEHGGNVNSRWLTSQGEELLEMLREWDKTTAAGENH